MNLGLINSLSVFHLGQDNLEGMGRAKNEQDLQGV